MKIFKVIKNNSKKLERMFKVSKVIQSKIYKSRIVILIMFNNDSKKYKIEKKTSQQYKKIKTFQKIVTTKLYEIKKMLITSLIKMNSIII